MRSDALYWRLVRPLAGPALGAAAVLVLVGCATSQKPAEPPPATTPTPAPRASSLSAERHWLQSWFEGTPVQIVQQRDGAVNVDVPREFCFDAGQSKVLAPLAAVLDKVSQSLRRTPQARLELLAAPGDDAQNTALALQRARQVRSHLLAQGVPAAQLGTPSASTAAAVQLRIALPGP